MAGEGIVIVMAKPPPGKESDFNRWYNEDHMPAAMARLPGVLRGRRYRINVGRTLLADGSAREEQDYQYMAIYEFASYEAAQAAISGAEAASLIGEYNQTFGVGGRHHVIAVELKAMRNDE